jgi:hypothetical protein
VIAKHRGVPATEGLKDAWSKRASRCTRTRSEAYGAGELAKDNEAHIHPGCAGCKFDGCVRKAVELTSGDLPFVSESTEYRAIGPDRAVEVSTGRSGRESDEGPNGPCKGLMGAASKQRD